MTNINFKKVKTLPTSGYSEGDIYFVSSEKKIYIRTSSGWEDYGGAQVTGGTATELNSTLTHGVYPITIDDEEGNQTLEVIYDDEDSLYYKGAQMNFYKNPVEGKTTTTGGYYTKICGKGLILGHIEESDGKDYDNIVIGPSAIYINEALVMTENNICFCLYLSAIVLSSNVTESKTLRSIPNAPHRVILTNTSGIKTVMLPDSPFNGETVEILRLGDVAFALHGNGKELHKCTDTPSSASSMTISQSGKYTCIYASDTKRWYIMRDDFVTF